MKLKEMKLKQVWPLEENPPSSLQQAKNNKKIKEESERILRNLESPENLKKEEAEIHSEIGVKILKPLLRAIWYLANKERERAIDYFNRVTQVSKLEMKDVNTLCPWKIEALHRQAKKSKKIAEKIKKIKK